MKIWLDDLHSICELLQPSHVLEYTEHLANEFSIEIMILFYHWKKNCLTNFNQMLEKYLNNSLNLNWISKRQILHNFNVKLKRPQ